jgi:hypothetical protein
MGIIGTEPKQKIEAGDIISIDDEGKHFHKRA